MATHPDNLTVGPAPAPECDPKDRDAVWATLRCVPRRVVVLFAARCARRVQPELLLPTPDDSRLACYHTADMFIAIAERFGSAGVRTPPRPTRDWNPPSVSDTSATAAYTAAHFAYLAADQAVSDESPRAAAAALAAYLQAAQLRGRAFASARHDLVSVLNSSRGRPKDFLDDRPVPDGFFGPLWLDGMPAEYEEALAQLRAHSPTPDELFLDLNDEGKAALADENWVSEQYSLGAFDEFKGEYIAVVGKKVLGHDKKLKKLRAEVSAATGIPVSRIVTTLIIRRPMD
jgi:hypothetical protein